LPLTRYAGLQDCDPSAVRWHLLRLAFEEEPMSNGLTARTAPVEYAVAVDRFLAEAGLAPDSRRVYRISLTSWTWPLVGKLPPAGRSRRLACPPVVPLALLEGPTAGPRLAAAVAHRIRTAQARTVNRELSALRSAIGWWQGRQWIGTDPTLALGQPGTRPETLAPLTAAQRADLFAGPSGLREQSLWHLLQDFGGPAEAALGLDAGAVDVPGLRARSAGAGWLSFSAETGHLLGWLLAGRRTGPVFLTDRRAPAGTPAADRCPLTGRGRMSYRRAAEIFAEATRPLDAADRGWTLHQLRSRGGHGLGIPGQGRGPG
jgi:integrase/recombinase XerD